MAWYPLGHGDKALLAEPVFAELDKGVRYYTATPEMLAAYAAMELRPDL